MQADYFRRQAEFYLRLSEFCIDDPIADRLRLEAADCHQRALMAEFGLQAEPVPTNLPFARTMLLH